MIMSLYISVVVCTYNRSDLLKSCLLSLNEQTINRNQYEVIIVDNNSTDQTEEVANSFTKQYINFRYCKELKQGLSHARNRGYKEACGKYVAYVDDDCKVPTHWLEAAIDIIETISPSVFGGPIYPYYDTRKPRWFRDSYESEAHLNYDSVRKMGQNEYLSGGNIFFHRPLLQDFGGFRTNIGMTSGKIAYGEETELQKRIRNKNPDAIFYYDPRLYVNHLVRAEKMLLRSIVRNRFINGQYNWLILESDKYMGGSIYILRTAIYALLAIILKIVIGVFFRNRAKYPYLQNYLYEEALRHVFKLGQLYGQCEYLRNYKNR